ncbi:hypothetical protein BGW39_003012, partial [Mortierella sp. 14UC]
MMDILALIGVIKKSEGALKGAFGLWIFLVPWSTLGVLGLVLSRWPPEQDEELLSIIVDYFLSLAYGGMMYQYRQLLKKQADDE